MPGKFFKATLGLGGNIGDVTGSMITSLDLLQQSESINICKVSSLYKTPPWGITSQNWFINACVEVETTLRPIELLQHCQTIETQLHRKRTIRWGPRTIDIDILTYEGFESDEEILTVPHPRMLERAFVLVPLAEILPELLIRGKPVAEWLDEVDRSGIETVDGKKLWWPVA